jgi:uncharacterized glyoxalase superfamily protein PhnB
VPFLVVRGAGRLITFLEEAFGAREVLRVTGADGTVGDAQVAIGSSMIDVVEAIGEAPPMPSVINLYVKDVDDVLRRAVRAGASKIEEAAGRVGARVARVADPFGNRWNIIARDKDVPAAELAHAEEILTSPRRRG